MPKEKIDILTLVVSALAFVISLIAFVISLRQKKKEELRDLRKYLSETMNELAKVNVLFSQILVDTKDSINNEVISLRRSLNGQRRTLLAQADLLVKQNMIVATEIDLNLLANGFNAIGNYPEADNYWKLTIERFNDVIIKHMNMRGYAGFLFTQGNIEIGRSKYKEALELRMPDTENVKRTIADTYIMWARNERDFGFIQEVNRVVAFAKNSCDRISHRTMKADAQRQIILFEQEN